MEKSYRIGVDVGGTKTAYGLFDKNGRLLDRMQHASDKTISGEKFSDQIIETVHSILKRNSLKMEELSGIGICMPSYILFEEGYVYLTSALTEIHDFAMKAYMEKHFPGKGGEYAKKLRDYTIALYKKCADYALSRGIIIADTKFEFGLDEAGNVVLGDEMLTPDSSRFWPLEGYEPGHGQPSFDKQFVRDWLKANPDSDYLLPQDVIDKTIAKYLEAYELLTGKQL